MKTKLLFSVFLLFVMLPVAKSQWTYTNLSSPRDRMGAAVLGTKAYFAGGENIAGEAVSTVQVYDVKLDAWDTGIPLNLSAARMHLACVAAGSKVFFAGGLNAVKLFSEVDIWDTVTKQWTVKHLSVPRVFLSAVSNGEKVLFAGGVDVINNPSFDPSFDVVDIYDIATGLWSVATLSIPRTGMGAAVAGNRAFFAGGYRNETSTVTNRIDIYDFSTNTWSTDTLSEARGFLAGVALGNKVLFAGGTNSDNEPSSRVDIFDVSNGTWSTAELSEPRALFPDPTAAAINNYQAVFGCGGHFDLDTDVGWTSNSEVLDIYNSSTNTWSTAHLTQPLVLYAVAGLQNHFIVAGGASLSLNTLVDKVEIYSPTLIHVPADYPKIQLAIDAASDGDTVLVAENTYYENINFKGKAIVIGSEFILDGDTNHIPKTIINGSQPLNPDIGSVVTFESGEDTTSVLCGFTITGGTGTIERNPTIETYNWRLGGGVKIQTSGAKLLYNYIEGNIVSNTNIVVGGGVCAGVPVNKIPWVVVRNNKIRNNKALSLENSGEAGGIFNGYNLIMADNEISYNEANGYSQSLGGGAFIYGGFGPIHVNIRNNLITENKGVSLSNISANINGGGLNIWKSLEGIVSDNIIYRNKIEASTGNMGAGAGVFILEATGNDFIFENNLIDSNTYDGGICVGGGMGIFNTRGKFQNNVIVDNKATRGGGITIANNPGGPSVLINNTIAGNDAKTFGAGLYIADAKAVVINTILWGNTALTNASIYQVGSTLKVRYSDVQGSTLWPGEGNMNVDPEFETDGYHLTFGSPLLNKGKSSVEIDGVTYNCPLFDFDGEARPYENTEPEIGAVELQTDVSIGEPIWANGLSINLYPNPANRIVTISAKNMAVIDEVEIYNQTGQLVLHVKPVKNTLDISGLQPGVYCCHLKADKQVAIKKIVKY